MPFFLFVCFNFRIRLGLTVTAAGINSNMRRYIGIRGLDTMSTTPLMLMMGMISLVPSSSDWFNGNDIMIRQTHAHIWCSFGGVHWWIILFYGIVYIFLLLLWRSFIQKNICNSPLATCIFFIFNFEEH